MGTILYGNQESSGSLPPSSLYCYYPGRDSGYSIEMGESYIKRVKNITECKDWYGIATFSEVSNRSITLY